MTNPQLLRAACGVGSLDGTYGLESFSGPTNDIVRTWAKQQGYDGDWLDFYLRFPSVGQWGPGMPAGALRAELWLNEEQS